MTARNFKNLQTSIIGQEADLAAYIFGLTDGKKLNDPEHRQSCPICGNDTCFYFRQATAQFCCEQCNFSGELIQLVHKAKNISHNEAHDVIVAAITVIAQNANTLNSGDIVQMTDDRNTDTLPSTVDTMSKNAGVFEDNDSVNTVNSEKTLLPRNEAAPLEINKDYAQQCVQWGLCAIPPAKGEKRPLGNWKEYQKRMPTDAERYQWQAEGYTSMGIVCGAISGNLLVLDFDKNGEAFEAYKAAIPMELWQHLVIEQSPSGGYHIFIRSEQMVNGNTVLAKDVTGAVLIETRGEGGYVVCHPSPGYALIQGGFENIPVTTPDCIGFLLNTARSFDQTQKPVPQPITQHHHAVPTSSHTGTTDFDWFVHSGEWIKHLPDLEMRDWKFTHEKDGQLFFQTPDGERGNGKHDGNIKNGVAYFFSRAPFPFEPHKGYTICRLFAGVLFGDFDKRGLAKLAERYFSNRCEVCDSPASEDIDVADLRYAPFPIECFSKVMQNITRGVQRTIGLKDSSAPAVSCLSVFSAVIGAGCKIRIKPGYEQPAHIFAGIVRKSGRAKSPAMEYFLEVFEQKQSEWVDEWNVANDTYKQKMTAWNAKPKERRGDCPDEPAPAKRLVVTDFTIEALARRLNENPLGLFAYADELEALFGNMGRYNSGKDMPHYIAIHNGKPLTIDRVKDGLIYIPRPSLSICGAIQPSILRKRLGENPDYFHSGFIARFLLTMPPDEPIKLNRHRLTDAEREGYEKFITSILSVREKRLIDGKVKPIVFDIASDAFDLLVEYQHKHADLAVYETENNSGAEGKFMTNAARIALILHVADLYDNGHQLSETIPISATTMRNACIIAEWFVNEAKRIYASLVGGQVEGELTGDQREVMKVLRRLNKPATPREMKRPSRVLQRMDNLDDVLQELVRLGRIEEQFRDDGYHKNGALEYRIASVATVDADTMSLNTGENRHAVNADAVSGKIMAMPSTDVIEGFEEYQNPQPADEAVMVEPEEHTEKDLSAELANMLRTSLQPIPFSQVLSNFYGDRVQACQFLKDNGFEIRDTSTGEQRVFVPKKVLPSATRRVPASYTSPEGKYEMRTSPEGLPVRFNNWQGIKGKINRD